MSEHDRNTRILLKLQQKIDLIEEYRAASVSKSRRNSKQTDENDENDATKSEKHTSASSESAGGARKGTKANEYSSDQADAVKKLEILLKKTHRNFTRYITNILRFSKR